MVSHVFIGLWVSVRPVPEAALRLSPPAPTSLACVANLCSGDMRRSSVKYTTSRLALGR